MDVAPLLQRQDAFLKNGQVEFKCCLKIGGSDKTLEGEFVGEIKNVAPVLDSAEQAQPAEYGCHELFPGYADYQGHCMVTLSDMAKAVNYEADPDLRNKKTYQADHEYTREDLAHMLQVIKKGGFEGVGTTDGLQYEEFELQVAGLDYYKMMGMAEFQSWNVNFKYAISRGLQVTGQTFEQAELQSVHPEQVEVVILPAPTRTGWDHEKVSLKVKVWAKAGKDLPGNIRSADAFVDAIGRELYAIVELVKQEVKQEWDASWENETSLGQSSFVVTVVGAATRKTWNGPYRNPARCCCINNSPSSCQLVKKGEMPSSIYTAAKDWVAWASRGILADAADPVCPQQFNLKHYTNFFPAADVPKACKRAPFDFIYRLSRGRQRKWASGVDALWSDVV